MVFCCGPNTVKCTVMKVGAMEFKTPLSFFFFSRNAQSKFVRGCFSSLHLVV